jgi:cytosine/adenosine deaminase-related metal-dependent hydrolase
MTSAAFTGATVIDVIGERLAADQTVLVSDGRISAVGPRAELAIPPEAHRHDVTGHWVLPGLVDMHCHLTGHDDMPLELFLVNGVTTVRDPGGVLAQQRLLREQVQAGERLGPRILIAGELLDGNPPVWPNQSLMVDTPERGVAAVRHLAAQGVDCVKIYNHVPEDVLAAVIVVARELGLPVVGHVPRRMSMLQAIQAGMNGLEHIRITGGDFLPPERARQFDMLPVGEREPRLWELIEPDEPWIDALIDAMVTNDVTLDPTLLIDDVIYGEGIARQADHADNAYLPSHVRRSLAAEDVSAIMQMPDQLRPLARATQVKRHEFVRRCWQAGVRITAGTDGAGPGRLLPGFGLHREIGLLREAGLSPFASLQAATISAAQALNLADQIGSIEAGKIADFSVWAADPLTTHLRPADLDMVVLGGVVHRHGTLAAVLDSSADHRA